MFDGAEEDRLEVDPEPLDELVLLEDGCEADGVLVL